MLFINFLGKNGLNFNKISIKLCNEALIGKKCRNKSWRKLNLSSENVNMEYVCMLVCPKNHVLCQILGKNGQNFNKISTKLRNEALIWKMYRNKNWRKLNLSSENVNIEYVRMLVCQENYVLRQFLGKNGQTFNKISTKLHNEALIVKMYMNKSWRKLKKFTKCL